MRGQAKGLAQAPMTQRIGSGAGAESVSGEACQQLADTKAFKAFTGRGRAGARQVRHLQTELDGIHAVMEELARMSHTVPGRSFFLTVHRRASNSQCSLRWRSAGLNRHLAWKEMPALFDQQLPMLAKWYYETQTQVEALNADEVLLRGLLRSTQRLAQAAAARAVRSSAMSQAVSER